jgi:uncharacterized protein (TIGR02118 family)
VSTTPTLFLVWGESPPQVEALRNALAPLRGLVRALAFLATDPAPDDAFAVDGPGPPLTLELGFADLAALENAAATWESARAFDLGPTFTVQAMLGRRFATPDPSFRLGAGERPCTLLVAYSGACGDLEAWLDHYDAHHPPIMVRFPAVRDVATYRPLPEARLPVAWGHGTAMQRNKVVFDSHAALRAALASPIRREMRADFEMFPSFTGRPTHFPTATFDLVDAGR